MPCLETRGPSVCGRSASPYRPPQGLRGLKDAFAAHHGRAVKGLCTPQTVALSSGHGDRLPNRLQVHVNRSSRLSFRLHRRTLFASAVNSGPPSPYTPSQSKATCNTSWSWATVLSSSTRSRLHILGAVHRNFGGDPSDPVGNHDRRSTTQFPSTIDSERGSHARRLTNADQYAAQAGVPWASPDKPRESDFS
jgi:hypothetical protein